MGEPSDFWLLVADFSLWAATSAAVIYLLFFLLGVSMRVCG